ncbi:hypothetical protein LGZ99_17195 [Photorhabdus temperata]|uniref:phage neck terminator protein n=1 Tax=Photorhabdus temperata TaxID=574560 RepID=UPI00055BCC51|nr:hypothetical protein [Photorhabdus temperata]MCT8348874.1 hypothetical protein [Photorhabdus temperata]
MEGYPLSDSTQPGWLTPLSAPDYDREVERKLSRWISSVSGLPGKMMFPKWQPNDETRVFPSNSTDWCAFGILSMVSDDTPAFVNQTDESTELWRHEKIECLISFYGPAGQHHCTQFRDGITLSQNNDELGRFGLSLSHYGCIFAAPELINNQWVRRYDMTITLRRKVVREYGVKSLVEAPVKFFGD